MNSKVFKVLCIILLTFVSFIFSTKTFGSHYSLPTDVLTLSKVMTNLSEDFTKVYLASLSEYYANVRCFLFWTSLGSAFSFLVSGIYFSFLGEAPMVFSLSLSVPLFIYSLLELVPTPVEAMYKEILDGKKTAISALEDYANYLRNNRIISGCISIVLGALVTIVPMFFIGSPGIEDEMIVGLGLGFGGTFITIGISSILISRFYEEIVFDYVKQLKSKEVSTLSVSPKIGFDFVGNSSNYKQFDFKVGLSLNVSM